MTYYTVWQKLEEQNPEFFKAYYTRLKLKKQIVLFNHLLEQQVQLMQKMRLISKTPLTMQNGVHPVPSTVSKSLHATCRVLLAPLFL